MPRIQPIETADASGKTRELYDGIEKKMGKVPNIFKLMGNSPAALEGYLSFSSALSTGVLPGKLRELIAIAVAETNQCEYCLSAHVAIGKSVGLSESELKLARETRSEDPKVVAALTFVRTLLTRRALIDNNDVQLLREAGYSDAEIAEIVANVALNVYTNYFNLVMQTEVDFPRVPLAFPV